MCRVKDSNLSYESLTSYAIRDRLRNLKKTDPDFWKELITGSTPVANNAEQTFDEDNIDESNTASSFDDDSDVICNVIIAQVGKAKLPDGIVATPDGNLARTAEAESMEVDSEALEALETEELGPGKRKRRPNTLYKSSMFWRHHDNDDPNLDM